MGVKGAHVEETRMAWVSICEKEKQDISWKSREGYRAHPSRYDLSFSLEDGILLHVSGISLLHRTQHRKGHYSYPEPGFGFLKGRSEFVGV